MSAAALLAELCRRGIRLEAQGDKLRFSPRSAVTPDLVEQLNAHKADLLALLKHTVDMEFADLDGTRKSVAGFEQTRSVLRVVPRLMRWPWGLYGVDWDEQTPKPDWP